MIRIMICDDQAIIREGLVTILSTDPEISVAGTAANGEELLAFLEQTDADSLPQVILLDLKMPIMNGISTAKAVRNRYPHIKILVLTTYDDESWVFDAIRSGASGYILKDTPKDDLLDAVKGTAVGDTYVDPSVAGKVLSMVRGEYMEIPSTLQDEFSDRELKILLLIARGYSNTEIAESLYLSPGTVRNYISAIFSRLGTTDRTQAAIAALRNGLIRLQDI